MLLLPSIVLRFEPQIEQAVDVECSHTPHVHNQSASDSELPACGTASWLYSNLSSAAKPLSVAQRFDCSPPDIIASLVSSGPWDANAGDTGGVLDGAAVAFGTGAGTPGVDVGAPPLPGSGSACTAGAGAPLPGAGPPAGAGTPAADVAAAAAAANPGVGTVGAIFTGTANAAIGDSAAAAAAAAPGASPPGASNPAGAGAVGDDAGTGTPAGDGVDTDDATSAAAAAAAAAAGGGGGTGGGGDDASALAGGGAGDAVAGAVAVGVRSGRKCFLIIQTAGSSFVSMTGSLTTGTKTRRLRIGFFGLGLTSSTAVTGFAAGVSIGAFPDNLTPL